MSMLAPGDVVDGLYEIVAPIAKGGTATVWAARQLECGGSVAIKVLALGGEDRAQLDRRFFREILLANRVRHPNVVEVHDFGALPDSGHPYLVMELLRGTTLHRHLRRSGGLTVQRTLRLFLGVLEALASAHASGVVHQDLKPSNLFLCEGADGRECLVLLDFGIAQRLHGLADPNAEWTATPRYAAPEYLRWREVGPALDVYQLGLVLAETLSGRPVVASTDTAECFRAHLAGDLPLPPEATGSGLGPLIHRCLAMDPEGRFANAGELLDAMRASSGGARAAVRVKRPARRRDPQPARALPTRFDPADDAPTVSSASAEASVAPRVTLTFTRRVDDRAALDRPRNRWRDLGEVALAACALALVLGIVVAVALEGMAK